MQETHTQAAPPASPGTSGGQESEQALQATQESLDKVREILFGSQMREQDHRFAHLEEKLAAELAAAREETRKQLATLQEFVKSELAAVGQRLTQEIQQRNESQQRLGDESRSADKGLAERLEQAAQSLSHEQKQAAAHWGEQLQSARGALEGRIANTEQQQAAADSELRAQLLEQTNRLRDEGKQWQSELQGLVEKLVSELRTAKTDRTALASLFNEMAGKLQG